MHIDGGGGAAPKSSIAPLIDEYVSRGVFRAATLPVPRSGVEAFRLIWFQRQEMTLTIDHGRCEARLSDVLPHIASRSKFDRQLRAWLRERSAPHLPAHRRIDPAELQAKLTNRAGHMQLGIASANDDLLHATRKLLQLTNELYLDFLSAPQAIPGSSRRSSWIRTIRGGLEEGDRPRFLLRGRPRALPGTSVFLWGRLQPASESG